MAPLLQLGTGHAGPARTGERIAGAFAFGQEARSAREPRGRGGGEFPVGRGSRSLLPEVPMDVVVKSRHCSVSDQFRALVEEKLTRLEKLDDRVIRVEVEVSEERNKRQHDQAHCVEITLRSRGPVVRAEAASTDKIAALDMALDRVMAQLRKAADRKKVHRG